MENPPDFDTLNRAFLVPTPLRRSKRHTVYDPDFLQPKKFKGSSCSANLLELDFSSGDDSQDEHFVPIVTAKNTTTSATADQYPTEEDIKTGSGTSEVEDSDEDEQSLAEVFLQLKKQKASMERTSKE